jgi:hypothetical protein
MFTRHVCISVFTFLVFSIAGLGCGDSSTGSGTGGSLGRGGSGGVAGAGAGGFAAGGASGAAAGGAGGSGGAADAAIDLAVSQPDGAPDAPLQPIDVAVPPIDAAGIDGAATLAQIKSLIAARCAGCHTGTGSAATRIDFTDNPDAGSTLYARLLAPLLLETHCGENIDAGGDAAPARRAIVPGDPSSSFFYLKITGTQPSPGNPPANCGVRMPRVLVPGVDGGPSSLPACDTLDGGAAANCLGTADIELVHQWILEGAPQ